MPDMQVQQQQHGADLLSLPVPSSPCRELSWPAAGLSGREMSPRASPGGPWLGLGLGGRLRKEEKGEDCGRAALGESASSSSSS